MIKTEDLTLFSIREKHTFQTMFELDLQALRTMQDEHLKTLLQELFTLCPSKKDQRRLKVFVPHLRHDRHRHVKKIRFPLTSAESKLCKPLSDIDLLVAFMHRYLAYRKQVRHGESQASEAA